MNEIFTFGDKAIELTPDEIQQVAESYNWPFEWQVATRLKTERDEARAELAAVRTALNAAPDSDVASLAETLVALIDSIPNVVNYVTSTLDSAARNSDGEWGEVHRGRAWSSINQLKGLKKRAYEALEGQHHEQD